jgi:hypothetical protein
MGNCLPSHGSGRLSADFMRREEFIVVTRSDGKMMEYTAPLLVRDLMAAYPQHSLVHSEDATCRSLSPDKKLLPGQLYRLLLVPNSPSLSKDAVLSEAKSIDNGRISRKSRASTRPPSSVKCVQNGSSIMRVKIVIPKRELQALLSDKSLLLQRQCKAQYVKEDYVTARKCSNDRWRPSLESIPEVN